MKSCPRCKYDYLDDTLEFCLEDGTRLLPNIATQTETPTITIPNKASAAEKTFELSASKQPSSVNYHDQKNEQKNIQNAAAADLANENSGINKYKIVEISSVTIALAHNWWQWLYLNNQYYSSFSSYVLSANFLMWLLLLTAGTVIGLYSLKKSPDNAFSIMSLVILSINLLLFLVPKR